jgi:hypothetical protein
VRVAAADVVWLLTPDQHRRSIVDVSVPTSDDVVPRERVRY